MSAIPDPFANLETARMHNVSHIRLSALYSGAAS